MSEIGSNRAIRPSLFFEFSQGGGANGRLHHGPAAVTVVSLDRVLFCIVVDGPHTSLVHGIVARFEGPSRCVVVRIPSRHVTDGTVARPRNHGGRTGRWYGRQFESGGIRRSSIGLVGEKRRRLWPLRGHPSRHGSIRSSAAAGFRDGRGGLVPAGVLTWRIGGTRAGLGESRLEGGQSSIWPAAPCHQVAAIGLQMMMGWGRWCWSMGGTRGFAPGRARRCQTSVDRVRAGGSHGAIRQACIVGRPRLSCPVGFEVVGVEHLTHKARRVLQGRSRR